MKAVKDPVPIALARSRQVTAEAEQAHAVTSSVSAWIPDGPAIRFPQLLKVTRVGRSKAYELMKTDPTFPKGFPLFDSPRSPKIWWYHEVVTWIHEREKKYRNQ
jgi:predicted DNA-binding transcriptional regulator AlpA